jgi:hypothetical protein
VTDTKVGYDKEGNAMTRFHIKMNRFVIAAIFFSSALLLPTYSFANLNDIACRAVNSGCEEDCDPHDDGCGAVRNVVGIWCGAFFG